MWMQVYGRFDINVHIFSVYRGIVLYIQLCKYTVFVHWPSALHLLDIKR